jgi:hypothetical protein
VSLRMHTNLRLADMLLTTAQQRSTGQNLRSTNSGRHCISGGQEDIFQVLKVRGHFPLVLLVEVMHMVGLNV